MNSPIRWFGGKGHLTQYLIPHIPPKYTIYVEPFGGGASLLFAKEKSKVEVYNDKDGALVNFFRVLRFKGDEFIEKANLLLHSRREFDEAKSNIKSFKMPEDITSNETMEWALEFYIMGRQSMSGSLDKGGWSYGLKTSVTNPWLNAIEKLPMIVERFRTVQVENLDATDCIKKYDTPETFFYVDPPYHHTARSSHRYRVEFTKPKYLCKVLKECKGMVLVSGYGGKWQGSWRVEGGVYDTELADWHKELIDTVSQATKTKGEGSLKKGHKRTECLWWNEALENAGNQMTIFEVI